MFYRNEHEFVHCLTRCLAYLLLAAFSASCFAGNIPQEIRRNVRIDGKAPSEFASQLSQLFGTPVCVEETSPAAFSFAKTNASLGEILALFADQFPAYGWAYDGVNGVVNIFPRQDAPAGWSCQIAQNTNTTIRAIAAHDYFGLKDRGISLGYPASVVENGRLTLCAGDQEFRKLLNGLCIQLPWCSHWTMKKAGPNERFWEAAKRPIAFHLNFANYRRHVTMTVCFRGVAPPLQTEVGSRDAVKFMVGIRDSDREASRLLEKGEEIGGLKIVEYKREENRLVFERGDLKMELTNNESRTYQVTDLDTIKKWLSASDAVALADTNQTAKFMSADIERRRNDLVEQRASLSKYAQKFPAGSRERQLLERDLLSLDAQISSNVVPRVSSRSEVSTESSHPGGEGGKGTGGK